MSSYPSIDELSPFQSANSRTPLMAISDAASEPLPSMQSPTSNTNRTFHTSPLVNGDRSSSQPITDDHGSLLPSPTRGSSGPGGFRWVVPAARQCRMTRQVFTKQSPKQNTSHKQVTPSLIHPVTHHDQHMLLRLPDPT